MEYKTAFNPGVSPVSVDAEGRTIGGGEWGTVDASSELIKQMVAEEYLVLKTDEEMNGDNPVAKDAQARTVEMRNQSASQPSKKG